MLHCCSTPLLSHIGLYHFGKSIMGCLRNFKNVPWGAPRVADLLPEVVDDFFTGALEGVVHGFGAFAQSFCDLPGGEALRVLAEDFHFQVAENIVAVVENVVGDVFDDEELVGAVGRRCAEGVAESNLRGLSRALAGFSVARDRLT